MRKWSHLVEGFRSGDRVLGFNGWQDYSLSGGTGVTLLDPSMLHPSWTLRMLGMPGFTAWAGLIQIGMPKPSETACVAEATGPVGATVGQIAGLDDMWWAPRAGLIKALMQWHPLGLMPASTIYATISQQSCKRRHPKASTSILRM